MTEYTRIIRETSKYPTSEELSKLINEFKYKYDNSGKSIIGWDGFNDSFFYMSPECEKKLNSNLESQYDMHDYKQERINSYNKKFAKVFETMLKSNIRDKSYIDFSITYPSGHGKIVKAKSSSNEIRDGFFLVNSTISNTNLDSPQEMKLINKSTGKVLLDVSDKVRRLLSDREMEIVELLANGNNDKEIGKILFLIPYTVMTHRRNIIKKMNAKNTVEAVVKAYRLL